MDPWTTNQAGISHLYYDLMLLLMLILIIVITAMVVLLYNGYVEEPLIDRAKPYNLLSADELLRNSNVEIVWTVVPMLILILISFPIFSLIYSMGTVDDTPDVIVSLVASQWMWEVRYFYPSSFTTSSLSILPAKADLDISAEERIDLRGAEVTRPIRLVVGQRVQFICSSSDVIHSFSVMGSGIKLDCTPGRLNTATVTVIRSGIFYGACYELCGVGHAVMPIAVHVFNP